VSFGSLRVLIKLPQALGAGMGEIEKVGNLASQYQKSFEKSHISLVKIYPFRMKKFDINELIQDETFFQRSVF